MTIDDFRAWAAVRLEALPSDTLRVRALEAERVADEAEAVGDARLAFWGRSVAQVYAAELRYRRPSTCLSSADDDVTTMVRPGPRTGRR